MIGANHGLTRRHLLKVGGLTIAVALPGVLSAASSWAQGIPLRKNIDALSADELDTYEHAVQILIDRGTANPSAMDGYAWQAVLHNDFDRVPPDGQPGGCEHRNEIFFPWHRAHLAGFEKILRETDPPRTANVTIPYWDWTKAASGVRFPAAFEETTSPLFHEGRYKTAADVPSFPGLRPILEWDADEVKSTMVQEHDWFLFAGYPIGTTEQGPGALELRPHNTFHPSIGPTMGNPATASLDPIYWSFHAYIDLVWARWQRVHVDGTHPQLFATPNEKIWVEPFIPTAKEMASTETMPAGYEYGYDYDFSIDGTPILIASSAGQSPIPVTAAKSSARLVTSEPLRISSEKRKLLKVRDVAVLKDVTFMLSAYVHPASVDIEAMGIDGRQQYLADSVTMWMSGGHAHHPTTLYFDLTKAIDSYGGDEFSISVVAAPLPPAEQAPTEAAISANDGKLTEAGPLWGVLTLEER
jgi:hypothetical protein